jgi:uncharacterized protein YebE (UPF0316 family)
MFAFSVSDPAFFSFVVVPILIFFARIIDVSMDTVRIICISKGYKMRASVLGFFEVIIWLIAITQIMQNLTNAFCYVAYGAGFAAGTYIGMLIEERFPVENNNIASVAKRDISRVFDGLKNLVGMKSSRGRLSKYGWARKAR